MFFGNMDKNYAFFGCFFKFFFGITYIFYKNNVTKLLLKKYEFPVCYFVIFFVSLQNQTIKLDSYE